MKITSVSAVPGKGDALFTDLLVTVGKEIELQKRTRVRITDGLTKVGLALKGAGSGKNPSDGRDLCLLVDTIADIQVRTFVVNKEFELL